ncbi:MAG: trypsin-like peptidase domain-containing protein [Blastocatellales bacterium]
MNNGIGQDKAKSASKRREYLSYMTAAGACLLALGILIGVALDRGWPKARAVEVTSELSSAFVEVARQVEPSVVNVSTVTRLKTRNNDTGEFPVTGPRLDSIPLGGVDPVRRGNGSGVIVDSAGYILTNHHVIFGADRIKVNLFDGTELPAVVVGYDRETDLAVVKVDSRKPLPTARFGDSDRIRVGDWVLAIGSPFGFDQTVTAGIISSRDRDSTDLYKRAGFQYFLQTDAAINRGNSGGPLINLSGEVIGINTAIATSTGDYNGISFALPASEAINVYRQLVKQGRVIRGFLGALTERVTPQIAAVYGIPAARGAIVSNVDETMEVEGNIVVSPAAKAGLKPSDIIVKYRGTEIRNDEDLVRRVASTPVGTTADLTVIRDGREIQLNVAIGRRPDRDPVNRAGQPVAVSDTRSRQNIGISFQAVTPARNADDDAPLVRGVRVVRVDPGSIADDAGLKVNDIIEFVNRTRIVDNEDFKSALGRLGPGDPVVLQIFRERLAPVPRIFVSFSKP